MGLIGFAALLGLAFMCSEDRRRIRWRTVLVGIGLQIVLAVLLIHLSAARGVVLMLNGAATALQDATDQGTAFLFGYLDGGKAPFDVTHRAYTVVLAFKILPLVLVISALGALLVSVR